MTEAILSLDIGGTNCRIGLVGRDYTVYGQKILSTALLAEQGFMESLVALIQDYRTEHGGDFQICAAALGFPSTIDRSRRHLLSTPNISGLDNLPVVDILEDRLQIPVFLERDVNLLLMYDLNCFQLMEEKTVMGVYFGTGIGNAIYLGGELLYGRNGVAGELGHIPQLNSRSTYTCGCGNPNCIEGIGGGKYLEALCSDIFKGTKIKEIYKLHRDTPQVKAQIEAMAAAVASEVNILDPDYVILGGGLLQMAEFPLKQLEEGIHRHTRKPYPEANLRLLYSDAKQENGIIGAGIYAWRKWEEISGHSL